MLQEKYNKEISKSARDRENMSKLHLSLFLFCLSIAVCNAGVLPRASNELQNDLLNFEAASEKAVSELGKNGDKILEDGNREQKKVDPEATNWSLNVSESETTKIEDVLNITNAFSQLDDAGQGKDTSLESNVQSGASQFSPIKLSKDSKSKTSELKDVQNSDLKTANLESIIKSTSDKISNETGDTKWPLKELLNETTDNPQVSRSQTNNSEFLLLAEETDKDKGGNKTVVSEILDASFSLLPNETIESDNVSNTGNSSFIKELEIFLNETEVFDAGNFNNSEFIEEIELSINITGDGEELLSNLSSVIKTDNSSDLMNDPEAFRNANFSGNLSSFEEHNASSVVISNETEANISDKVSSLEEHNSSFTALSNDTESLSNKSFDNITGLDVANITSSSFSNVADMQDSTEGDVSNSEDSKPDSFNLNETEANDINAETMSDSENLSVESDVGENTPLEGSFPLTIEKESEGLFSNFGFDFLKNSQIAKNAAKAMEIFNLSDSITDHIIEEHEFHSFLDATPPSADDVIAPVKLPQEQIDPSIFNINGSPEGLKTLEETAANASEEKTSLVNEISDIEGVTLLNDTMLSDSADSSSKLSKPDFNNTDEANLQSNSSESQAGFNETLPEITSSSTSSIPDVIVNNATASPKCPPPGVCIFFFLAQDTCAVNSHCLGTRICCKIRCSKTCIEV